MFRLLIALGILGMSASAAAAQDAKKELAKFQGTWTVKELKHDGKVIDNDKAKFKVTFKKDVATVEGNDELKKEYARFSIKLDPSTMPKILDIKITAGAQKDVTMEGIYEVKDDELKICVKVIGNERPTTFDSAQGSNIAYLILKKE
jgi:uncharacterized protein (TIGR03067 family)